MSHDPAIADALARLMAEHGLTHDTRLFRESLFSALTPTGTNGVFHLAANPQPRESVVVEKAWYVTLPTGGVDVRVVS